MKGDSVVFPNAEVYASKAEYDAWMKMPADRKAQVVKTMDAYKDRLHFLSPSVLLSGCCGLLGVVLFIFFLPYLRSFSQAALRA